MQTTVVAATSSSSFVLFLSSASFSDVSTGLHCFLLFIRAFEGGTGGPRENRSQKQGNRLDRRAYTRSLKYFSTITFPPPPPFRIIGNKSGTIFINSINSVSNFIYHAFLYIFTSILTTFHETDFDALFLFSFYGTRRWFSCRSLSAERDKTRMRRTQKKEIITGGEGGGRVC